MGVNLSIKNVPEKLVKKLRQRAAANHRSVQGELMNILEANLPARKLNTEEVWKKIQALGYKSPDESARMIREDRDSAHGRDPLP